MRSASSVRVCKPLVTWDHGDQADGKILPPLVYSELNNSGRRYLRRERLRHAPPGASLVHKIYVRLILEDPPPRRNRGQFFNVAAELMQHESVDHGRNRLTMKLRWSTAPAGLQCEMKSEETSK